jgi:hypothetical protein
MRSRSGVRRSDTVDRRLLTLALLVLALAGCGGGGRSGAAGSGHATVNPPPFAWLAPRPAGGWAIARLPSGSTLSRPPGWQVVSGDTGTASFAMRGAGGAIVAYLNATPRQGGETLANWATFRPNHNAEEGSRGIRRIAAAHNLHFRSGPGSCVIDQYRTAARSYREIACLVSGPRRAAVVVGAATPETWAREAPVIERAISAFTP